MEEMSMKELALIVRYQNLCDARRIGEEWMDEAEDDEERWDIGVRGLEIEATMRDIEKQLIAIR